MRPLPPAALLIGLTPAGPRLMDRCCMLLQGVLNILKMALAIMFLIPFAIFRIATQGPK